MPGRCLAGGGGSERHVAGHGDRGEGGLLFLPLVCAIDLQAPSLSFTPLPLSARSLPISTHLPPPSPPLCISQHLVHCFRLSLAVRRWQAKGQSLPPSKDDFVLL